jgi:hypothetical protein
MADTLNQTQLAQIVSAVIQALQVQGATPKASSSKFLPKGAKAEPSDLASKDAHLVAAFARKGFRVTLMDRDDPAKPYDVRPFKGWLEQGRIVRKGSKGIRGLFHITQTDPLPVKTAPKAKPASKAVKPAEKSVKAQLPLV